MFSKVSVSRFCLNHVTFKSAFHFTRVYITACTLCSYIFRNYKIRRQNNYDFQCNITIIFTLFKNNFHIYKDIQEIKKSSEGKRSLTSYGATRDKHSETPAHLSERNDSLQKCEYLFN